MKVVAVESGVHDNAVLVGIVYREGIAALVRCAVYAQFVVLLKGGAQNGILPVCSPAKRANLLVGISSLVAPVVLLILCPL
jgi:hypothetical protein